MVSLFKKNKAKNKKELWALALSAPLFQINQFEHHYLYGHKSRSAIAPMCNFIERDWSIHTAEELNETLKWLETSGHKDEFMNILSVLTALSEQGCENYIDTLKENRERYEQWKIANCYKIPLRRVGIAAWDIVRYVFLCRTGAAMGLISEKAAWARILEMAPKAQMIFSGWPEYVLSYFAGRQYWLGNSTVDFANEMREVITQLFVYDESILRSLDWLTPLK
jgi:hypothetical protein